MKLNRNQQVTTRRLCSIQNRYHRLFLRIFPSARYDYISDIDKNVFSGNFGINLKPFRKSDLNIKASAGNNFAAPTFNELYWKTLAIKIFFRGHQLILRQALFMDSHCIRKIQLNLLTAI
ncbi:MAG: hypothetical protein R3A12_13820 [Ignavibacteria bacterium]